MSALAKPSQLCQSIELNPATPPYLSDSIPARLASIRVYKQFLSPIG